MSLIGQSRRLRREQTKEEKQLWQALRAGRFAGFKFRRQHPLGSYILDFYCALAQLSVELDGSHHGHPEQRLRDEQREQYLVGQGVVEMRFWNRQWRENRSGVLLEIWEMLNRLTGETRQARKEKNQRFIPPDPKRLIRKKPRGGG